MTKGRYSVVPNSASCQAPPSNFDTSFHVCLCTILFFLVVIILILLLPFLIRGVLFTSQSPPTQAETAFRRGDSIIKDNEVTSTVSFHPSTTATPKIDHGASKEGTTTLLYTRLLSYTTTLPTSLTTDNTSKHTTHSVKINSTKAFSNTSDIISYLPTTETISNKQTENSDNVYLGITTLPTTTSNSVDNDSTTYMYTTSDKSDIFTTNSDIENQSNKTNDEYSEILTDTDTTTKPADEFTSALYQDTNYEWLTTNTNTEIKNTVEKLQDTITPELTTNTYTTAIEELNTFITTSENIQETTEDVTTSNTLTESFMTTFKPLDTTPITDEDHDHELEVTTVSSANSTMITSGPVLCKSNICKRESSLILSYIDHSYDYCQDFYEYACGGLKHTKLILEDDPEKSVYNRIRDAIHIINDSRSKSEKILKSYYDSCLHYELCSFHERTQKSMTLLNTVGSIYTEETVVTNLTDTIAKLIQLGSFPIFDVRFDVHSIDRSKLQLRLSIPVQDYLFSTENEKKKGCRNVIKNIKEKTVNLDHVYDKYTECMLNHSDYIRTLGHALSSLHIFGNSTQTPAQIQHLLMTVEEKLLCLDQKMPKLWKIQEAFSTRSYDTMSVKELQKKYYIVDWKQLFQILLNKPVDETTVIQVYFKQYFDYVFGFLSKPEDLWKVSNALLANFIHNIYKYFINLEQPCNREDYCVKIASRLMPDVVSNLFMNSFNENDLQIKEKEVTNLVESVRKTMLELVNESRWMDEESIENVKSKINSLKISVPSLFDSDKIENDFEKFIINDTYILQSMNLLERKQDVMFGVSDMNPNSDYVIWLLFSKPYSSESIYIYETNTLVIPEILLWKYNRALPDAINIARLGHIIARGFSHAFDRTGVLLSKKDYNELALSSESFSNYNMMLANADNTFSYTQSHKEDGMYYTFLLISLLSMNDRLSDISATKLALETLRRQESNGTEVLLWGEFTEEQLYFITLAQTFCSKKTIHDVFPDLFEKETLPPFLRIRNMFSNSVDFNISYPCPIGSWMNSLVKVDAFPLFTDPFDYF